MKTIKEGYLLKTYTDKKNKQTHKAFLYVARTKENKRSGYEFTTEGFKLIKQESGKFAYYNLIEYAIKNNIELNN